MVLVAARGAEPAQHPLFGISETPGKLFPCAGNVAGIDQGDELAVTIRQRGRIGRRLVLCGQGETKLGHEGRMQPAQSTRAEHRDQSCVHLDIRLVALVAVAGLDRRGECLAGATDCGELFGRRVRYGVHGGQLDHSTGLKDLADVVLVGTRHHHAAIGVLA